MTAVTRNDYNYLKNEILLKQCNYSSNELHIAGLKHRYEAQINSIRRLSQINTLAELLEILEKRDCVSENDVTVLEDIAKYVGNNNFLIEINSMRRNEGHGRNRSPIIDSRPDPVQKLQLSSTIAVQSPTNDNLDVKSRVYNVIVTEIGYKWIDFARELKVSESKIDNLKINTDNNFEKCARAVLAYHEQNVHQREWKTRLLKALEKARRNDLKSKVIKIFDDFS